MRIEDDRYLTIHADVPLVFFRRIRPSASLPRKGTKGAAAWDLCAAGRGCIQRGETHAIPTGLNVRLPRGFCMRISMRSGLAMRQGLMVANAPGLVDPDFCGDGEDFEIKVIVHNAGTRPFTYIEGDRIAQATFERLPDVSVVEDTGSDLWTSGTDRVGGLGSTGVAS